MLSTAVFQLSMLNSISKAKCLSFRYNIISTHKKCIILQWTEKLAIVIMMQERMNRSLMVCQDKFEAAKLHKNRGDAAKAMESCVNTSIEDSLDTLPHIVQRMKTSFSIAD